MPISSQTPIIGYVANGVSTEFTFPFVILSADDLKVSVNNALVSTGITITGVGDRDGGTVTFSAPPAALAPIILYREVSLERTTDYQENGDLLASVLDDDIDRIWLALQDQAVVRSRTLQVPVGETVNAIPKQSDRALRVLGFDEMGQPIALPRTDASTLAFALQKTTPGDEGAKLVGADDGASGSLFTTVAGFIARLMSWAGSAIVGFKQAIAGAAARTVHGKLSEVVSVLDFGAVGDGVADDSDALEAFWEYVKDSAVNFDPTTLDWVTAKYVIPPRRYRVTRSINWTNLLAWNIHVEAEGALVVAEVNSKTVFDMLNTRGVHLNGLAIQTAAGYTPTSAILLGIGTTGTCGNNRLSNVKTAGSFSIAACHNIGSETTRYDFCYWQNKVSTGYAYAGDCNNLLGAVSDYVTLRAPGTPVSFTSNSFYGCRFANYAASGQSVYLEGTAGWFFDKQSYFLAFDNANIVIRQAGSIRTASLKINGLFETSQGAGVKDCVKIICDDGVSSAIDGFELDVATPHASRSVIRLETPAGTPMTTGEFIIRTATIKWDAVWTGTPTLFSGARLSFQGDLYVRPSANINLSNLVKMYGAIYTTDASLVTKGADGSTHAYMMCDTTTLAGQGISFGGIGGGFVGIQSANATQRIRVVSSATNSDLWLSGKGTGRIRFGTRTASADAPVTGYIEILDDGGTIRRLAVIG